MAGEVGKGDETLAGEIQQNEVVMLARRYPLPATRY